MHVSITGWNICGWVIALVGWLGRGLIQFFLPERFYLEWFFLFFWGGGGGFHSLPQLLMVHPLSWYYWVLILSYSGTCYLAYKYNKYTLNTKNKISWKSRNIPTQFKIHTPIKIDNKFLFTPTTKCANSRRDVQDRRDYSWTNHFQVAVILTKCALQPCFSWKNCITHATP